MTDDKCNRCAHWTPEAAQRYGGKFNDGDSLTVCQCPVTDDDEREEDEDDS